MVTADSTTSTIIIRSTTSNVVPTNVPKDVPPTDVSNDVPNYVPTDVPNDVPTPVVVPNDVPINPMVPNDPAKPVVPKPMVPLKKHSIELQYTVVLPLVGHIDMVIHDMYLHKHSLYYIMSILQRPHNTQNNSTVAYTHYSSYNIIGHGSRICLSKERDWECMAN